ncbi:MAG: pyridoxamine 5'-phosphate oxidase family protein [Armatimonadota bacterium]
MRRADREITDQSELEALLKQGKVLNLGLWDGDEVYVVPLNYGYRDGALYVHSALEGRKIDILRQNSRVCFSITITQQIEEAEEPCEWGTTFCSLIGYGVAHFLETPEEKLHGLEAFMAQFTAKPQEFSDKMLEVTAVIRLDITELTGKRR